MDLSYKPKPLEPVAAQKGEKKAKLVSGLSDYMITQLAQHLVRLSSYKKEPKLIQELIDLVMFYSLQIAHGD